MRLFLVSALAALLAAPCAVAAEPAKPPTPERAAPAQGMKIGYVDFTRVWSDYHRRNDFDKELRTLKESRIRQVRAKLDEADRLEKEIRQLAMGTKERLDLEEKRKAALKESDDLQKKNQEELTQKYVVMLNQLFGDMLQEVEAVAKEGDFDMVIKDQSQEANVTSAGETVLQISQRVVLCSKPEYDLTSPVLKRLNEKYDAQRKAEAPAPAEQPPAVPAKEKQP